ncbi:hypothetical protein K439DRAFT_1350761 [Ramaria rubella]|nr:hypothetical protein K439DRAFT_1350761 [Ramaria rubella]
MDVNELSRRLTVQWIDICARRGRYPRAPSPSELTTIHVLLRAILSGSSVDTTRVTLHGAQSNRMLNTIQNLDKQMDMYENPGLLDEAMTYIPLQELHDRAERLQSSNIPLPCFEDALADVLVKWFRDDFFVWIDRKVEKCPTCGEAMGLTSSPLPSEEERKGGASRVEMYTCKDSMCTGNFRFARYNDPTVLMRTRVGRCGEFANLFTLFLRAIGLRAQYVWNMEDHVWNSYFSPGLGRWIHLDSCEAARDQPLLYSKGWGKKMSYCLAFSIEGAMDVSRGYIQKITWEEAVKARNMISEEDLDKALKAVTTRRRLGLPADVVQRLEKEDFDMLKWLEAPDDNQDGERLEARQSGNEEWKEARGEAGPT